MSLLNSRLMHFWRKDQSYRMGDVSLRMPSDHALPRYQSRFPTYDAFLPLLAPHLPAGSLVIDIGANVGDTIAGMASTNRYLKFAAVEPNDQFLSYLVRNCESLRAVDDSFEVEIVRAFISDALPIRGMEGKAGTRRAVVGSGSSMTEAENISLDELAARFPGDSISLIKVDTDGFDWSVIASGRRLFNQKQPLLFFETELGSSSEHFERYAQEIKYLEKECSYRFTAFDNFGVPVALWQNAESIINLLEYLVYSTINKRKSIYYFDILAATSASDKIVKSALQTWKRKFTPG